MRAIVKRSRLLEMCSIFYILSSSPKITRYELRKRLARQGVSLAISTFYDVILQMVREEYIECDEYRLFFITQKGQREYARVRNIVKMATGVYAQPTRIVE
jgi:DNA-binding PadR family transcriptional regulator